MTNNAQAVRVLKDYYRHDIFRLLTGDQNIGVELGIAEGVLSERAWKSGKFGIYIGVDMYADGHDTEQYKRALRRLGAVNPSYKILRMRFDQAVDLFDDNSLDFIYVDGYAHSGEEGGSTFVDWYPKLKIGGLFSGDDYHEDWPNVKASVDYFVSQIGEELMITERTEAQSYCEYPSWAVIKSKEIDVVASPQLIKSGKKANQLHRRSHLRREFIAGLIPTWAKRLRRATRRKG